MISFSFCFDDSLVIFLVCSHKVYMKIQELMMKKLALPTWEEVEQAYPMTSSYNAMEEFIVFREWVCVSKL